MNPVADYAYRALDRAMNTTPLPEPNERGEVAGCGAVWACGQFGRPGHDYLLCPVCNRGFNDWLLKPNTGER